MPSPRELAHLPLLIEFGWEVCNQVGGIYTVLRTKAPTMVERWGRNYILIGPYYPSSSQLEFEETECPNYLQQVLATMQRNGVRGHFGHWLIPGRPQTLLLEFESRLAAVENEKYFLWKDHGIACSNGDDGVDRAIAFGVSSVELLQGVSSVLPNQKIVAHFHEWQAAVAIPRVRHLKIPLATVFTTHATQLGRYLAADDPNFYNNLESIDPGPTARAYNVETKYLIERVSAHAAHVFTTISDVTAREAKHLLGRAPDFILPNGLNPHRFVALHEFQNLHLQFKNKIHEFVMGHFFPSYSFDLDRTLYVFTSGRYEYRNKGMDIFIEAIYRLNQRLKLQAKPPTVVAFIVTRGNIRNLNVSSLQNHLTFEDLKSSCDEVEAEMHGKLLDAVVRGRIPSYDELLSKDILVKLKRAMLARRSASWPPIVTHDLNHEESDAILNHLKHRGLFNSPEDPVKVVFHPEFMSSSSALFGLDYDQFVRGCHMGIFPSYYEPWGYTPLECLALGLPTVTTDLSGFGTFVHETIPDALQHGVLVLNRSRQTNDQTIDELTHFLLRFCELSRRERIALRNRAERLTERFTWTVMGAHYHRAHTEALLRCY